MTIRTTTIRQTVVIPASPEAVYSAFVDPETHAAFTGERATFQSRVGGRFTAWGDYIEGRNLVLEKGKRLVQERRTSEWPEGYPPSILELSFTRKGRATKLRMVHSKVPAEQAPSYREGWHSSYWEPLKAYFSKR